MFILTVITDTQLCMYNFYIIIHFINQTVVFYFQKNIWNQNY